MECTASDIPLVVQVFTWLNIAYKFLKHYKVIALHDEMLKQNDLTGQYKMQSLSETHWFARSRNLDIAVNAHGLLVDLCDKVMSETKLKEGKKRSEEKAFDADLRLMAEGLRRQLLDHNFCITLLVIKDVFSSCNAVSEHLQKSAIDLLAAIEAVNNLRVTLLSSRTDESYAVYEEVIELLNKKRQIHSTEDTEAYVPQPSQKRAEKLPARLYDGQSRSAGGVALVVG